VTRRLRTIQWLAVLALILFTAGLARPAAAGDDLPVGFPTSFLLLTGSPEPAPEGTNGVLMVPGTVIPVTAGAIGEESVDALLASGRAATDLAQKLRTTLRLQDIQVQYLESKILDVGASVTLPAATPESPIRPVVTLLGLTDELATYRVVFEEGDRQLSDTSVSVPLGRRSVVGALDGAAAPYLFLVIEPPSKRPLTVSETSQVTPPRRLSGPAPSYPEDARKERIEGVVILQAVIAKDGSVAQTRVLRSLSPSLDRASEEAIRKWTFAPATLDGKPVSVFYNLTVNFRLTKDKEEDKGDDHGEAGI